jgi:predicted phage terminase large subunit-like protein
MVDVAGRLRRLDQRLAALTHSSHAVATKIARGLPPSEFATPDLGLLLDEAEAGRLDLDGAALEAELVRRAEARADLLSFVQYTFPRYTIAPLHAQIAARLEEVEAGRCKRLIVECPPRHGKSELVSVRFPAWYLGRNPQARVIATSYSAELSFNFSRQCRNIVTGAAYGQVFGAASGLERPVILAQDSRSVAGWDLSEPFRGGYVSAGVGGSITGKGAHVLLIDDPVKDAVEAASAATLDGIWSWYRLTAYPRLEDGGAIIVCMTRWAEGDLVGRLLQAMEDDDPAADRWEVLRLPALAEEGDPLGRAPGQALWPEKYDEADLARTRATLGPYGFAALYQQRPAPLEGNMFPLDQLEIVDAAPADGPCIRYWDKAATEGGGAYTAGVRMTRDRDGVYYIGDVVRGQWSSSQRNAIMRQTAELDGRRVRVWIEQEPGSGGKESAEISVKLLAGFVVSIERVTGDKVTRAAPFAAQAQAGNVRLVRGAWNRAFLEEAATFPYSRYLDQIDAAAGAFNKLALAQRHQPARVLDVIPPPPDEPDSSAVFAAQREHSYTIDRIRPRAW